MMQTSAVDQNWGSKLVTLMRTELEQAILLLRQRLPNIPIVLLPHIQPWFRKHGAVAYQKGLSVEVISLESKVALYHLAQQFSSIYLVDPHAAFFQHAENALIRHEPLGGHPERSGAHLLLNELKIQMASVDTSLDRFKVVAIDLDDTLWRGSIHDGTATFDLQFLMRARALHQLAHRGLLIVVVSKNEPTRKDEARKLLQDWCEGLDKKIVSYRLNWKTKAENLIDISSELEIGLDSFAFFDDSQRERNSISFALPEVSVFDAIDLATCISFPQFQPLYETQSSKERPQQYLEQSYRKTAQAQTKLHIDFLHDSKIKLLIRSAEKSDLARVAELLSRTNQLNSTLKRMSLSDLLPYQERQLIIVGELYDRFGDFGVVAVAVFQRDPEHADMANLLELAFSCRILELGVEETFIKKYLNHLNQHGITFCNIEVNETERNQRMIANLKSLGFTPKQETDQIWIASTSSCSSPSAWISVILKDLAPILNN
jgi:FkbH-like protein